MPVLLFFHAAQSGLLSMMDLMFFAIICVVFCNSRQLDLFFSGVAMGNQKINEDAEDLDISASIGRAEAKVPCPFLLLKFCLCIDVIVLKRLHHGRQ